MSKGQTTRIKLTVPRAGATADEIVREVNRLPFGYMGFNVHRTSTFSLPSTGTWTAVPLTTRIFDTDAFVNTAGTQAKLPDDTGGLWVFGVQARGVTSSIDARIRLQLDGVTVLSEFLQSDPRVVNAVPLVVNDGSVLTWEVSSASTDGLVFQAADDDDVLAPQVFGYRVGLLP